MKENGSKGIKKVKPERKASQSVKHGGVRKKRAEQWEDLRAASISQEDGVNTTMGRSTKTYVAETEERMR